MTVHMHERAIEKIKGIIRELIINPELKEGPPFFNYKTKPFEDIASELNKRKNGFDANAFICEYIFVSTSDNYRRENSLSTISDIAPENLESYVDVVFDCYNGTPFEYEVEFPLKQLGVLPYSDNHPFINIGIGHARRFGLLEEYDEYVVFKIKSTGCFTGYYPASFMKTIFQGLNIFIFLLKTKKILTKKSGMHSALSFPAFMEGYIRGEPAHNVTAKNIQYPYMSSKSTLSLSVSKYLSEIVINSELQVAHKNEKKN